MQKKVKDVLDFDINLFSKDLNKEQKEAVDYYGRPQIVLSGAGSGKTRVLTYKIIYLIKVQNIPPENILALTFTNKAANEMKERIAKLIGEKFTRKLVMGTFHSVFCKILRKNIQFLQGGNYNPNFKIIVEHQSKDIIKSIIEDNFYIDFENYLLIKGINDNQKRNDELRILTKKIYDKISYLKNVGITYDRYHDLQDELNKDKFARMPFFKNVYQTYVETCRKKNVMDFEDLLLNTFLLFNDIKNINILNKYQNLFKYILVDEYQDTNKVQYEIVKALSWDNKNIFVVGDDYQNIYSFRGADRLNIKDFKNNFNNCKETIMCQNFRSNEIIVNTANKLIKNNKNQIIKELYSNIKEKDGKIKLIICKDGIDESNKVAISIKELISQNKCNYSDIAILYRMNVQYIPFKKSFFRFGIPHKIHNANTIFDSKIIKTIYYYLQFIDDQSLDFCLKKIINFPKRNIGGKTVDKLFTLAKLKGINCWEIINNYNNEEKVNKYKISNDMQKKLIPFKDLINHLISFSKTESVYSTVLELLKCINIDNLIKEDSEKDQIKTLLDKVKEIEEEHIKNNHDQFTLNDFLEDFSLLINNEECGEIEAKKDQVKLMTIHQAKGLEFKYVFIVGLEKGYYPCGQYKLDEEEMEEERRILYVAITRAKLNCFLSYATSRLKGDEMEKREPSPFLDEIYDSNYIEIKTIENQDNYRKYIYSRKSNSRTNKFKKYSTPQQQVKKSKNNPNIISSDNCDNIKKENSKSNFEFIKKIILENNSYFGENKIHIEKLDNNENNIMNNEENKDFNIIEKKEFDSSKEKLKEQIIDILEEISQKKEKKEQKIKKEKKKRKVKTEYNEKKEDDEKEEERKQREKKENDEKKEKKQEKEKKEKKDNKFLNKKRLNFRTIDSFFNPK